MQKIRNTENLDTVKKRELYFSENVGDASVCLRDKNKFMLNEGDIYINVSICDTKRKIKKDNKVERCLKLKTKLKCKNEIMSNNPTSNFQYLTSNTAITLIALIITIIVLLILAGVTLNMVIGNNGIMTKANNAKESTNEKSALEEVKLKILEIQTNKEYEKITIRDVFEGFEESKNFEIIQVLKDTLTGDIEKIYVKSNNYPNYIVEIDKDFNCRIVKQADIEVRLESIEIAQKPNKIDYYIGERFAADGMKVIAHYSNGESREIADYTYNTKVLDGTNNEIEIKYVENGIIKIAIQKINVSYKPYKIAVNDITTKGFKINLDLTEEEMKNIKDIKYYVNNTKEGTNYQTSNIVSDLGDSDIRYVWTTITDNNGNIANSANYIRVAMAHTHNANCYNNIATIYAYQASGTAYGDTRGILHCSDCGQSFIGTGSPKKYISNINSYKNLNSDGTISKATWHATSHQTSWYIDSWTSGNGDVKVKDRVCVSCGTYLISYCTNAPSYAPPTRCGHYSKTLTCTKSTFTTQKSYDF